MEMMVNNLKIANDKLVFDDQFFTKGDKYIVDISIFKHRADYKKNIEYKFRSREVMTLMSCTNDVLVFECKNKLFDITLEQYIRKFVIGCKSSMDKETIISKIGTSETADQQNHACNIEKYQRNRRTPIYKITDEQIDIKSNTSKKFSADLEGKPFIFIDRNNEAFTINEIYSNRRYLCVVPLIYTNDPDNYITAGDIDEVTFLDRSIEVSANDFFDRFEKVVAINTTTLTLEEVDFSVYLESAEDFDTEKIKKIDQYPVVTFDTDGDITYIIKDTQSMLDRCRDLDYVSKVFKLNITENNINLDIILNSLK